MKGGTPFCEGAIFVSGKARHETSFTAKVAKGREGAFAWNSQAFLLGVPGAYTQNTLRRTVLDREDSLRGASAYVSVMRNCIIRKPDRVFTQPLRALRILRGKIGLSLFHDL